MNHCYSWLNVRSVDEDKRIIHGIATTPAQARDNDILETAGIQFKLPIPFLWRHKEPFGNVIDANVGAEGIAVRIQIGPPGISQAIDEQWNLVKHGIVRGLSIGWRTLKETFDKEIGGYRITQSEWLELSAVPVPADANATITSVRSADQKDLAALGNQGSRSTARFHTNPPGVTGSPRKTGEKMKSFEQQIKELEEIRVPIQQRMTEVMEKTQIDEREMDPNESTAYDADAAEIRKIDADLDRLRAYQQAISKARPVPQDVSNGGAPSGRIAQEVKKVELPKGNLMARAAIAQIQSVIQRTPAADLAARYYRDTPEVAMYLRASVAAADTTTSGWASQLVPAAQQMQNDFLELLRPSSLLGRIPGLRNVPFNVAVPLQTGGGTFGWVGESAPKPVTSLTLGNVTLRWAKVAAIIVFTKELAKFSSPSAEGIIRDSMVKGVNQFLDGQFVDPAVAAVTNVSPASITNGITPLTPTGTTADDLRYDIGRLMAAFIANNQDPTTAVLLMNPTTAANAALMMNSLGQKQFDDLTVKGGSIAGIPVIVSNAVGTRIILLNASDILFADDGGVNIDVSEQATVEMNTVPITGEASPITGAELHSLWQRNEIGLRVERFITWARARTSSVEFIATPLYVGTHT